MLRATEFVSLSTGISNPVDQRFRYCHFIWTDFMSTEVNNFTFRSSDIAMDIDPW
jgi:hypothetical protein